MASNTGFLEENRSNWDTPFAFEEEPSKAEQEHHEKTLNPRQRCCCFSLTRAQYYKVLGVIGVLAAIATGIALGYFSLTSCIITAGTILIGLTVIAIFKKCTHPVR